MNLINVPIFSFNCQAAVLIYEWAFRKTSETIIIAIIKLQRKTLRTNVRT